MKIQSVGVIVVCFLALFLVCYAPALFHNRQFGFRDAGYFYYPLHQRVQEEWNQGRWPLWEPEENGGVPLLGNPTAAVLYPGKLIFAVLPYAWGARFYIVMHTALAFVAMLVLLRRGAQAGRDQGSRRSPTRSVGRCCISTATSFTWSAPRGFRWECTRSTAGCDWAGDGGSGCSRSSWQCKCSVVIHRLHTCSGSRAQAMHSRSRGQEHGEGLRRAIRRRARDTRAPDTVYSRGDWVDRRRLVVGDRDDCAGCRAAEAARAPSRRAPAAVAPGCRGRRWS